MNTQPNVDDWTAEMFRQEVEKEAASEAIEPIFVRNAMQHYSERLFDGESDVAPCVSLARLFRQFAHSSGNQEEDSSHEVGFFEPIAPEMSLTVDLLLDRIAPDIEKLRTELFGSPEPPFPEYDDAVAWIQREASAAKQHLTDAEKDRVEEIRREVEELMLEFAHIRDRPLAFRVRTPLLSYIQPGVEGVRRAILPFDSPLCKLKSVLDSVSSHTGFSEPSLVAHVLTGLPPMLARLTVGNESFTAPVRPHELTITVRGHTVQWADLKRAYEYIQAERDKVRTHLMAGEDLAIAGLIRKHGGVPDGRGEKGPFWKRLSEELDRCHSLEMKPDTVRKRYSRFPAAIREELDRIGTSP